MKNIVNIIIFFLIIGSVSCANTKKNNDSEWKQLFNGEDLSGWIQRGGEAKYEVKEGTIVGTSTLNTPNSFLCTDINFGDFILELEYKVDPSLNSGIQIRSHSLPEYMNGRVHGYQIEIDPSERAWSAGIYDEARRGWLYPLVGEEKEEARGAFKANEWNKVRVEAVGPSIKTWLNDVPVTNLFDELTPEGFIALQVHSIRNAEQEGTQVAWRNIRIKTENIEKDLKETSAPEISFLTNKLTEYEKSQGWKLLFDGETSNGWRRMNDDKFPERGWVIKDGILTLESFPKEDKYRPGDIITTGKYSNFDLKLEVMLTEVANSGIKYFVVEDKDGRKGSGLGLEYQILDDQRHPDAKKGDIEGSRTFASLYDIMKAENKRVNPIGQWNTIRIVSKEKHVEHWLNGFKVLEYERGGEDFRKAVAISKFKANPGFGEAEEGHILLQDHSDQVSFRSIKIRELNNE